MKAEEWNLNLRNDININIQISFLAFVKTLSTPIVTTWLPLDLSDTDFQGAQSKGHISLLGSLCRERDLVGQVVIENESVSVRKRQYGIEIDISFIYNTDQSRLQTVTRFLYTHFLILYAHWIKIQCGKRERRESQLHIKIECTLLALLFSLLPSYPLLSLNPVINNYQLISLVFIWN